MNKMNKLLMHTCCGPCLLYPAEALGKKFDLTAFYFNPNIHPETEFKERLKFAQTAADKLGINFLVGRYKVSDYFQAITPASRCQKCLELRLKETAKTALSLNIKRFSTTLLVSPYQDHEIIKKLGQKIASEDNLIFEYQDFRSGFLEGQLKAKELNLYRQKFCGCAFSYLEGKKVNNEIRIH